MNRPLNNCFVCDFFFKEFMKIRGSVPPDFVKPGTCDIHPAEFLMGNQEQEQEQAAGESSAAKAPKNLGSPAYNTRSTKHHATRNMPNPKSLRML